MTFRRSKRRPSLGKGEPTIPSSRSSPGARSPLRRGPFHFPASPSATVFLWTGQLPECCCSNVAGVGAGEVDASCHDIPHHANSGMLKNLKESRTYGCPSVALTVASPPCMDRTTALMHGSSFRHGEYVPPVYVLFQKHYCFTKWHLRLQTLLLTMSRNAHRWFQKGICRIEKPSFITMPRSRQKNLPCCCHNHHWQVRQSIVQT